MTPLAYARCTNFKSSRVRNKLLYTSIHHLLGDSFPLARCSRRRSIRQPEEGPGRLDKRSTRAAGFCELQLLARPTDSPSQSNSRRKPIAPCSVLVRRRTYAGSVCVRGSRLRLGMISLFASRSLHLTCIPRRRIRSGLYSALQQIAVNVKQ